MTLNVDDIYSAPGIAPAPVLIADYSWHFLIGFWKCQLVWDSVRGHFRMVRLYLFIYRIKVSVFEFAFEFIKRIRLD